MYLKRLESIGFKSFAERVKIEFVPGVTAIVGPNGSGKSNITDAIKWVLGEQSVKSLRGSRMEDIIFQGSDSRNPLNVAEVTLVLDNNDQILPLDYKEISVTRRVYRSGESEFYINKQPCRLRDIIELFMDSGLGRDAFSIISQGKVEEVLSSKAEERRMIFEEAAGVLKYKQRKQKAEFKLSETEENLNRIDDIVYEIEQQIDPLYEQSKTAKQYVKLQEQLKEKEISVLVTEIEQLHTNWESFKKEVEEQKTEEMTLKTLIQKREASLEKNRHTIQSIDDQIDLLQSQLLSTTQKLEQYEGRKNVWIERTKNYEERKDQLELEINHTSSSIKNISIQLEDENEKLTSFQASVQETKQKIKQLKFNLSNSIENIQEKIEELKADYIEYLNQQAAKRNERQTINQQLEKLTEQNNQHINLYEKLLSEKNELDQQRDRISTEHQKLVSKRKKIEQEVQSLNSQYMKYEHKHNEEQQGLYKLYETIAKLNSRKEMLEEMRDDYQGFFFGVKNILKAKQESKLNNIFGAVVELIEVPEQYILSIETALGGQAQNIVVKDDLAAREAILWLRRMNKGRATFLPLQSIQPRLLNTSLINKIQEHSGFVGIASNIVRTEPKYQLMVDHLLGNTVITKNLKSANEISALLNRRYRIVTLDGDIVNAGGSMSGGATKNKSQSLFTREKELAEITNQLKQYHEKAKAIEKRLQKQKVYLNKIRIEIQEKSDVIQHESENIASVQESLQKVEMKLFSIQDNISIQENDQKLYEQDKDDLINRQHVLTEELTNIAEQLTIIQNKIDHFVEEEKMFSSKREKLLNDLHKQEVLLAEQEERERSQQEKTNTMNDQLTNLQQSMEKYTEELHELLSTHEKQETKEEIDSKINEMKHNREQLTKSIQDFRSNRLTQTQAIEDEERELKQQNKQHQLLLEKIQQKEVAINRLDVQLENRLMKLQTDYSITFERALNNYVRIEDIEQTKNEVHQLKQAIKNLGTVNLGAIDEYKRISERHQFLTEQKEDLEKAKETLFQIISEMDEVMKTRFEKTFLQIKQEFKIVFKELFGGGQAELKLSDPEDLLNTGIDIVAQPPGKKLQHLGLLSGGEKALTAIALLFAILRARPVPFCVLDEVEAALDEVNVVRFAKYVKMHSDQTQFIVITHRKGTMEEADVLYGVTMQESGVSRLVSVQLEETEELVHSS